MKGKLIALAREALESSPGSWDGARRVFLDRIRNDADLLWELLEPYRNSAVQILLTQASADMRQDTSAPMSRKAPKPGQPSTFPRPSAARTSNLGQLAVARVASLSILDTFIINGQPIGDVTSLEAIQWASARRRDAKFALMLASGLPQDDPIRKHRTAEEAERIYAEVKRDAA